MTSPSPETVEAAIVHVQWLILAGVAVFAGLAAAACYAIESVEEKQSEALQSKRLLTEEDIVERAATKDTVMGPARKGTQR